MEIKKQNSGTTMGTTTTRSTLSVRWTVTTEVRIDRDTQGGSPSERNVASIVKPYEKVELESTYVTSSIFDLKGTLKLLERLVVFVHDVSLRFHRNGEYSPDRGGRIVIVKSRDLQSGVDEDLVSRSLPMGQVSYTE